MGLPFRFECEPGPHWVLLPPRQCFLLAVNFSSGMNANYSASMFFVQIDPFPVVACETLQTTSENKNQ